MRDDQHCTTDCSCSRICSTSRCTPSSTREQASSDGGAVLLKAAERIYGLVKAFAGCLFDKRARDKTRHSLEDLIAQRIFGIACGHPDCNDGDRLADDPIHKLLLNRDPVSGESGGPF